jgi:hypothetical protein
LPTPRTEIYRGIFYQTSRGKSGVIHLLEIDLGRPGIELYLTPVNPEAIANGHEYRLDYVRNVARDGGLAIAVNGTLFKSDSYLIPMVGDFATSVDTIIAEYQMNHLHPRDYMLWFDSHLKPHVESTRPAPLAALRNARWAIGGRDLAIRGSKPPKRWSRQQGQRAVVGVDPRQQKMWLGVFESTTQEEATDVLMRAGAEYVMMLDGGNSTSLYLGGRAHGVPGGLRFGGQRPVATVIGVKADPILAPL